jgi:hypothetical protein
MRVSQISGTSNSAKGEGANLGPPGQSGWPGAHASACEGPVPSNSEIPALPHGFSERRTGRSNPRGIPDGLPGSVAARSIGREERSSGRGAVFGRVSDHRAENPHLQSPAEGASVQGGGAAGGEAPKGGVSLAQHPAVGADHLGIHQPTVLDGPFLGCEIDVGYPEAFGIAQRPFEIVEQGPGHVATHVHTL